MGLPALDRWLVRRMGWTGKALPSPEQVRSWQLERLRALIVHAQANSPFYARRLSGIDAQAIQYATDYSRLPMLSADDLREGPEGLLCVSRDAVARVVTLRSSGTTGTPKRVFHTPDDLEATVDYFGWGMRNLIAPGQTALVLMPGERPGGVGRLLAEAVSRFGGRAVIFGILEEATTAVDRILAEKAACIVGTASHVHLLAREWQRRQLPFGKVSSVLLCWDAVPDAAAVNIERIFGCRVFRHWGMVETGLGGAVECAPGSGLHLRETDVFVEVVDPQTGSLVSDGEFGELVVSTPLRLGMPLIRYRTGDRGRILPGTCRCNSPMRRLDSHVRRVAADAVFGGEPLWLDKLSEALFALPGLGDFSAHVAGRTLQVRISGNKEVAQRARGVLAELPAIAHALEGGLHVDVEICPESIPAVAGLGKRRIRNDEEPLS